MTTHTPPLRSVRRSLAAALAALLLCAGGLLVASPASAHDELVSTDPAPDSTVDVLPAELTLTFSGELLTGEGATEVQVTDEAGASLTDGDPVVEGPTVTQALAGEASGVITVLWKVVSEDGHPISDEYAFTVTAAPEPTPTETSTPTAAPTETPSETPTPVATETAAPTDAGASTALPWIIGGVVVAALVAGVIYLLVSRSRRQKALEEASADAAAASDGGPPPASAPGSSPSADR